MGYSIIDISRNNGSGRNDDGNDDEEDGVDERWLLDRVLINPRNKTGLDDGEIISAVESIGGFAGRDSKPPLGESHHAMN